MSSYDISCVTYNFNYQAAINQIAQDSSLNRTWTREEGFKNNPLIAVDPSCGGISQNQEQRMLNKKKYIFANNRNNVQSGSNNHVLTKAQIYSRVARGYTPQGRRAPLYGLQTATVTNPNSFNLFRRGNALIDTCCRPIGGVITFFGGDVIHTFITSGTFLISSNTHCTLNCRILIVGGGGAGGGAETVDWPLPFDPSPNASGGGGGGGQVIDQNITLTAAGYNIVVGHAGSMAGYVFGGKSGITGGGVLLESWGGRQGFSGGCPVPAACTRGASGGDSGLTGNVGGGHFGHASGGGGGDGTQGTDAMGPGPTQPGGSGGAGTSKDITGVGIFYGAGGGGGSGSLVGLGGAGGAGGGGIGASGDNPGGTASGGSKGAGGGGASGIIYPHTPNGGDGSQGVVIIRYTKL